MVTPVDGALQIDTARLAAFGARLLDHGANGLVPFGTMGEGPAFSAAQRLDAVVRLVELGLPADRIVLGIGGGGLADQAWLGRQAGELGLAAVLATPPFFFREVEQEGVYAFYAALAEALGAEAPPLLLYHIPQICGVPVAIDTVARLVDRFPGRIAGIKDSGADLAHTLELLGAVGGRAAVQRWFKASTGGLFVGLPVSGFAAFLLEHAQNGEPAIRCTPHPRVAVRFVAGPGYGEARSECQSRGLQPVDRARILQPLAQDQNAGHGDDGGVTESRKGVGGRHQPADPGSAAHHHRAGVDGPRTLQVATLELQVALQQCSRARAAVTADLRAADEAQTAGVDRADEPAGAGGLVVADEARPAGLPARVLAAPHHHVGGVVEQRRRSDRRKPRRRSTS